MTRDSRNIISDDILEMDCAENEASESCRKSEQTDFQDQLSSFQCKWSDCGNWYYDLDALANHVSKDHSNAGNGGLFYCKWKDCNRGTKAFNARYKMLVHIRTHTNEKPHQCSQCNKSFSRAENLKIHCRSHTGERPYICNVPGCGKAYSNSSDRFKHSRTHTIDKPYACKIPGCPKRYTDPSSLRKHVKTYKHYENGAFGESRCTDYTFTGESNNRVIKTQSVISREAESSSSSKLENSLDTNFGFCNLPYEWQQLPNQKNLLLWPSDCATTYVVQCTSNKVINENFEDNSQPLDLRMTVKL